MEKLLKTLDTTSQEKKLKMLKEKQHTLRQEELAVSASLECSMRRGFVMMAFVVRLSQKLIASKMSWKP